MDIGPNIDPLLTLGAARKAPEVTASSDPTALRRTTEEFEGFFLSQMLEHMFAGIDADGLFGGGHSERVWRSFLLQEYGKVIARSGGLGIADAVQGQLLSVQEGR